MSLKVSTAPMTFPSASVIGTIFTVTGSDAPFCDEDRHRYFVRFHPPRCTLVDISLCRDYCPLRQRGQGGCQHIRGSTHQRNCIQLSFQPLCSSKQSFCPCQQNRCRLRHYPEALYKLPCLIPPAPHEISDVLNCLKNLPISVIYFDGSLNNLKSGIYVDFGSEQYHNCDNFIRYNKFLIPATLIILSWKTYALILSPPERRGFSASDTPKGRAPYAISRDLICCFNERSDSPVSLCPM